MGFEEISTRFRGYHSNDFGAGATNNDIRQAEDILKVRLPNSYKAFLLEFGWGGVEHFEIYGLGRGVPKYLDLIYMTRSEREEVEPPLKRHLIPVLNDGGGNHYCLDTSKLSNGECPIVFWAHDDEMGSNQQPDQIAHNFSEWLASLLNELDKDLNDV